MTQILLDTEAPILATVTLPARPLTAQEQEFVAQFLHGTAHDIITGAQYREFVLHTSPPVTS